MGGKGANGEVCWVQPAKVWGRAGYRFSRRGAVGLTPAAKPTTKIIRTRAKANEASLPSHDQTRAIRFGTNVRRDGLFDRSLRPFENSDTAEVRLGFIGIPPSASNLSTCPSSCGCSVGAQLRLTKRSHGAG